MYCCPGTVWECFMHAGAEHSRCRPHLLAPCREGVPWLARLPAAFLIASNSLTLHHRHSASCPLPWWQPANETHVCLRRQVAGDRMDGASVFFCGKGPHISFNGTSNTGGALMGSSWQQSRGLSWSSSLIWLVWSPLQVVDRNFTQVAC